MSIPDANPEPLSTAEASVQREAIRRGLVQANTAALLVILMVVLLAVAAALAALRAERNAREANENERRAQKALWDASLAQARAQRLTHEMGQRFKSLAALRAAARLNPAPELRAEAITTLALPDFEPEERTFPGSSNAVAFAVDGELERYAVMDRHGAISVHRAADGQRLATFSFVTPGGPSLTLSPDGSLLAAKFDRELKVWSVSEGRLLWETNRARALGFDTGPRFSPGNDLLAYPASGGGVTICDAKTGQTRFESTRLKNAGPLAFHPGTNWLAVGCGDQIRLWDYVHDQVVRELPRHNADFLQLSWSRDGRLLAGGCDDSLAYVWNVETGDEQRCRGHLHEGVRGWLRPQGDLLVTLAWDRVMRVWDAASGAQLFHTEGSSPVGFNADGTRLAVFSQPAGLRVWRVHAAAECRILTAHSGARSFRLAEFSPDGRRVAGGTDEGVWIWDLDTGASPAKGDGGSVDALHFRGSNQLFTTGAKGVLEWQLPAAGAVLPATLPAPINRLDLKPHAFSSSVFLPDGQLLANVDSVGCRFDFATKKLSRFLLDHPGMDRLAISPNGRWIASGCWFNTFSKESSTRIWSAASGEPVLKFNSPNSRVAFSPDSRWFLASFPGQYQLRETGTFQPARVFTTDGQGLVPGAMAFSPDGQTLALRASERVILLADPATGQERARFSLPDGQSMTGLGYSPDGTKLAVTTEGNLQIWNLPLLRERLRAMNLDWPDAGNKSATAPNLAGFQNNGALPGRGNTAAMIIGGVALAIIFALAQQRYQRRVLAGYLQADALITRRNEELRAAQAELAHSQKMRALGALAAGIAHDFNNLLSVIRMSNKLIKRAADHDPEIRENVVEIETAVQQGKSVVQSMLGYSRTESDRVGPVSLPEVVEDSVGLLSKQFLSGLTLKLELADGVPLVNGSPGQVEQILLNLVVNAAEAMREQGQGELRIVVRPVSFLPGRLVLSPRIAGPFVELLVADTGPGIPPETLPRVFDAFFTTKSTGVTPGSGLGLSTVYTIAERAGYGIAVDSVPGRGAAFHVFFPVEEAPRRDVPDSHTDNRVGPA